MTTLLGLLPRVVRRQIIRSRMGFDESDIDGFEVSIAESVDDALAAARTVHASYVARGIIDAHPSGLRVTPHGVLPSSRVFVAKVRGQVVGTISLIVDSPLGLPMDDIYGTELSSLRRGGGRIAEVGALAIRREHRRIGLVFLLNCIMFHCAKRLGVERLVIAVHPDAEDLYATTMLFERFGPRRAYPGLNKSALAVALTLDLNTAEERLARTFGALGPSTANTHHLYFVRACPQISLPEGAFSDPGAAERRRDACAALVRARLDVFRALPRGQISYLRGVLPGVLWPSQSRPDLGEVLHWGPSPAMATA
jgi:hypothetical protein